MAHCQNREVTSFMPRVQLHSLLFNAIAFILLHIVNSATGSGGENHTDHLALLAIKSRITHDPQGALATWNTSLHFCQWKGVTCGRRHTRVTKLDLSSRGLSGHLSPHVGNLSFLGHLTLSNNSLEGGIPPQVGRLFRLKFLYLTNNSFEGEIPTSLSNCTRMTKLWLDGNKLVGKLPRELFSQLRLTDLIIVRNNFTGGIPFNIGNLTSLEQFFASENPLGGVIPHSFGNLNNLRRLGLALLQLSGTIPPSLYNISSLTVIDLSMNQIGGNLPRDMGLKLGSLQDFRIWSNHFTGSVPPSFANCSKLMRFELSYNNFSGELGFSFGNLPNLQSVLLYGNNFGSGSYKDMNFIVSMVNCSKLQQLDLGDTKLRGVLPDSIGNLSTQLIRLHLGDNFIHGPLPSTIGNLGGLELLVLQNNQLTGSIPSTFGNLVKLQRVYLQNNNLTGKIPDSIGNLSLVNILNLANNRLEQEIPSAIRHCQSLALLSLSTNNLVGCIPSQLFELSSLSILLDLSGNQLVGPLPQEIGNLKTLMALDVSQNQLGGEIPNTIGSCSSLEHLSLQGNIFQDSLPPSFSSLRGVQWLDLSINNLSGQVPRILEQLALSYLNLSFNNFEGEVPMKGVFTNASAVAIVGNTRLCGGVPELQLPKCPVVKSKKGKKKYIVIIVVISVISLLGVIAMALSFLFCCRRRKRQAQPTETLSMQSMPRVSYRSLHKATDGFTERNLIGTGSFSSVYKGILEPDGSMVAVKVLQLENQGAAKSFMAECEALRGIRHRNLLKIITCCSSADFQGNEFKALVYEYMPKGNLEKWLHPSPDTQIDKPELQTLNLCQRITIATDVAHAIHYLHQECQNPIIHCDLKPTNILLDDDMVAHVGDFGLARFLPLKPSNTSHSSSIGIRGTIGYAAPEYGTGSETSREGDVYSFGILLLEMMTGKRPTDTMFREGLNLHSHVKKALPQSVREIVEPTLLLIHEEEMKHVSSINDKSKLRTLEECLISWASIGVACSVESPKDRLTLSEAMHKLHHIKVLLDQS